MRGLVSFLFIFACAITLTHCVIIDRFNEPVPTTIETVDSNITECITGTPNNIVGGERDISVDIYRVAGAQPSIVQAGCEGCPTDSRNGRFSWSVPAEVIARAAVIWDGSSDGCSGNINYNGMPPLDLTDGGISDSIRIEVGTTDLDAVITITVYSGDADHSSSLGFIPGTDIASFDLIQLPFNTAIITPGSNFHADFSRATAIALIITGNSSVDTSLYLVETAPLLELNKDGQLTLDSNADGIANPGDRITYTLNITNYFDGLGFTMTGVILYDDPSTWFPGYTLVPNSVTSEWFTAIPNLDPFNFDNDVFDIPRAAPGAVTVLSGNGANDERVIVDVGSIPDNSRVMVRFTIAISNVPCCLPACEFVPAPDSGLGMGCQVPNQSQLPDGRSEPNCYCVKDISYLCSQVNATTRAVILDPSTAPAHVLDHCSPNHIEVRDEKGITLGRFLNPVFTPVFATTDPSLTLSLNTTQVVSGDKIQVTVTVDNDALRSTSNQELTITFPASRASPVVSTGFTCSAGQCTKDIGALAAQAASTLHQIVLSVSDSSTCSIAPFTVTAKIEPNAPCPTVGTSCLDDDLTNNQASQDVNVEGEPDLTITKTAQSSSVAPGESVTYTISYSNVGNVAASGVTLTETLPPNTIYSGSEGWSCTGSTCTLTVADVPRDTTRSTTFTITYQGPSVCGVNSFPNTVSISTDCSETVLNNNEASATVNIVGVPDLTLEKSGPSSVAVGGTATYTLTYSNIGNREINNVVLTESIPANTVFNSGLSTAGWVCSGASCTFDVGTLAAQSGTRTTDFAVTVNSGLACGVDSTSNTATINGVCVSQFSETDSHDVAITGQPDLVITKVVSSGAPVAPGGVVVYTIGYSNTGVRSAPNVIITENVPAKFTFVPASSSPQWTLTGSSYTINVGTVAAGASGSYDFAVRLDGTIECNEPPKINTATISTTCPNGEVSTTNNEATANVAITGTPDLAFTRVTVVPGTAPACSPIAVTFYYRNLGVATATNSLISVPLPVGTTAGSNPSWTFSGNVFTKSLGDIAPGATEQSQQLNLVLPCDLGCTDGPISGEANLDNDCGDSDLTNNDIPFSATATGNYDLYITKNDFDAVFKQRTSVTYTLAYGNSGIRTVTGAVITETVPQYTTFAPGAGWSCPSGTAAGAVCTYALGPLEYQDSGVLNVTMTIVDPIPFGVTVTTNAVSIGSTECGTDANLSNNNDEEPTPIVGNPDLIVSKSDSGATLMPSPAGTVVYDITYGNIGDVDAVNVVITERVPQYTVFVAASSASGWTCADGSPAGTPCSLNVGTVTAGGNGVTTFAVKPYSYVVGREFALRCPETDTSNAVTIAGDPNQIERNTTNNAGSDTTLIGGLPDLAITKTDGINDADQSEHLRAGDTATYTITWTNNGPREATNVVVTETVPQYTTFDSLQSSPGWSCQDGGIAGATCILNPGSVAPGGSGSTFFSVNIGSFPADATFTTNTVTITNACGEANEADNAATDTTPLIGFFDLLVQKHGHCASIVWTLNYGNQGDLTSRMPFLKAHVPADTHFNANESHPNWVCESTTAGSECLMSLPELAPGSGGSVEFVADPVQTSMQTEYTLFSSVDDNLRGEDLDPTPENNYAQATIGFDGCDTCDSCCPPVDTCCPDNTDVSFNFGGVLDGLKTCSS